MRAFPLVIPTQPSLGSTLLKCPLAMKTATQEEMPTLPYTCSSFHLLGIHSRTDLSTLTYMHTHVHKHMHTQTHTHVLDMYTHADTLTMFRRLSRSRGAPAMWSGGDNSLSSSSSSSLSSSSSSHHHRLCLQVLPLFPSEVTRSTNNSSSFITHKCVSKKRGSGLKNLSPSVAHFLLYMCVQVLLHQCPCAPRDTLMYMWGHYPISGDTGQNISMAHHRLGNKVACRSTCPRVREC